jgi:putative ABC transport system permease protein
MKAIDRKLLRDFSAARGQALAISLVIACGLATFVMSLATWEALKRSRETYYERYRFAEVFASLKRAPKTLVPRIEAISGVGHVQSGIVASVNLSVHDFPEPIIGRLVSIPERRTARLNDLHLRAGRWIERDRGEVIVAESFAEAHELQLGETISAILNGKFQELRLVGIAISPEYVYQVQPGALFPDNKRYGIIWIGEDELAASFDMEEAFNDLAIKLMPGANEAEVIRRVDNLTEPYGGLGAYGRDHQVSSRFLDEEIKQLRGMAIVSPMIFLGVAAFLLNVVMTRLVSTQREQIAALKAFGYSKREVAIHYLQFALIIVVVGCLLGVWAGNYLGHAMTNMYAQFYRFPLIDYKLSPWIIAVALFISGTAGCLAVMNAVSRAAALPPAEAMRPEPPATFRRSLVERLGLGRWLGPATLMMLRQLERRPLKSLLSIFGIAMAVSVLVMGNFGSDAIDFLVDFQRNLTQRQDVSVTFAEPRNARALREIEKLPGVLYQEGYRSVPCRLRSGHRSYLLGITGMPPQPQLARMVQSDSTVIEPPESDGVILSLKLADMLGVKAGDPILVDVLEGRRPQFRTRVEALMNDYTGLGAYMNLRAVNRFMKEGATVSGAHLQVDSSRSEELYRRLKEIPAIASVSIQKAAIESFQETFGENMLRMRAFNVFFACIIAFGVVYNNARIALAERSRELATLRVIGFRRSELSTMLAGEMILLTTIAIPIGWLIGKGFALMIVATAQTEFFRFPAIINRDTYAFATLVVLIATALSCLVILRRVHQLDMIEALKCKE